MAVIVESFENLTETLNSPLSLEFGEFGFLQPGYVSLFTFDSGVSLLEPVPNDGDDTDEVLVGDFDLGKATWGLGGQDGNGRVFENKVPGGTAYIGRNVNEGGTLTFGFDRDVYSVGAYVDTTDNFSNAIAAVAYDASGNVISGARIAGVHVKNWDGNFVGVESKVPIAKIVFTGDFLVLDRLTFDTAKPKTVNGTNRDDTIGSVNGQSPSDGSELILGKDGNDRIFAEVGDDTVRGGEGNDRIHGGAGNDAISGGDGVDTFWGDGGQDSFLFASLASVDKVKDFNVSRDSILLTKAIFSQLDLGTLSEEQFEDGTSASTGDVRILYDSATGNLLYDDDGNGANAEVQFAKLSTGLMMTSQDFFVV